MDNAIALGIKPLEIDVATPLMTAAKIRRAQQEEQQTRLTIQRDAMNATARGLAPLMGSPDYEQHVQNAGMQLRQQGILDGPGSERFMDTVRSPLKLQSALAATTTPELAQRQTEATQRASEHAQSFGLAQKQFGLSQEQFKASLMTPVEIGEDFGGKIMAVKDPASGGFRIIDRKTGQPGPALPPGALPPGAVPSGAGAPGAVPPGGPQPGVPEPVGGAPAMPAVPGSASGAVPPVPAAGAAKKSAADIAGQQWLDANVPKEFHKTVEGLANYEINPTTFSSRTGRREKLIEAAVNLGVARGESYDQKEYGSRAAAVKEFATGKLGNAIRSFDVGIDHLQTMKDLVKALDSGDPKFIASIKNKWKEQFNYDAPGNIDAARSILGAEISKAIIGGNSALADREELRAPFKNDRSASQILSTIDNVYLPLMAGQLKGFKKQYEDTTGRKNFDSRLTERTRQALAGKTPAAGDGTEGGTPATPGTTSTGITWSVE